MNVIVNGEWFSAIEIENENKIGVEIPKGGLPMFNGIFDDAHRTHGKSTRLGINYAYLHQEQNSKGKMSSKCKIGHLTNCCLEYITQNYHNETPYAFFTYEQNIEK
jgi:hypothetical protein